MQFPVELKLQPSPTIMASVLVAHVAAALALFHVHAFVPGSGDGAGDWMLAVLGWGVLGASLWRGLHTQHRLRECTIWLEEDGGIEFLPAGGRSAAGLCRVLPGSQVVVAGAVWFEARALTLVAPEAKVRRRRLMVVPDNLAGGGFRLLRAWLLHRAGRVRETSDKA
ncbi:protein YgfX [Thauera sp.]|jgi:hypothetical protein|uniref:protein YgfX n=1 Tax=Thauera sp. TaxID=1905334 RepID=UPI00261CE0C6|nr:protein YgfX [Thauera sp.]